VKPGFLGNTSYWFSRGLSGEYFDVEEVHSAEPTYYLRDTVRGKTGKEAKTKIPLTWTSIPISRRTIASNYQENPYGRKLKWR